jgi:hypothetical protein
MGGIGGIAAAVFGVGWIGFAVSIGAPLFVVLFGLVFVGMAIAVAVYHFYNANPRAANRMSLFDVTSGEQEPDSRARRSEAGSSPRAAGSEAPPGPTQGKHCRFCGTEVEPSFSYCPGCGKRAG